MTECVITTAGLGPSQPTHLANAPALCVATKFVTGACSPSVSVDPTICFTSPEWMSMHGRNRIFVAMAIKSCLSICRSSECLCKKFGNTG